MNTDNPNIAWLDNMSDHAEELNNIASQLAGLARAFERTGNSQVSGELFGLTDRVLAQIDAVRSATDNKFNHDYQQAVEGSAGVLKAVLAGVGASRKP